MKNAPLKAFGALAVAVLMVAASLFAQSDVDQGGGSNVSTPSSGGSGLSGSATGDVVIVNPYKLLLGTNSITSSIKLMGVATNVGINYALYGVVGSDGYTAFGNSSIRLVVGNDGGGGLIQMNSANVLHVGDNAGSYVITIPATASTGETVFGTRDGTTGSTRLAGDTIIIDGGVSYPPTVLTPSTTVNIDFNGSPIQTLANATNVVFTESNAGAGKSVTVILSNDATARNVTGPGWTSIGSTFPTSVSASKTLIFTVTHTGSTTNSGYVTSAAQP